MSSVLHTAASEGQVREGSRQSGSGPYSGGLKKTSLGPSPGGQHANTHPGVKGIEQINVLTLLLLPMTVNVHAYTPHEVFIFNEIHSQQ